MDGFFAFGQAETVGIDRALRTGIQFRPEFLECGKDLLVPPLFRDMGEPLAVREMLTFADVAVRKYDDTKITVSHTSVELQ